MSAVFEIFLFICIICSPFFFPLGTMWCSSQGVWDARVLSPTCICTAQSLSSLSFYLTFILLDLAQQLCIKGQFFSFSYITPHNICMYFLSPNSTISSSYLLPHYMLYMYLFYVYSRTLTTGT